MDYSSEHFNSQPPYHYPYYEQQSFQNNQNEGYYGQGYEDNNQWCENPPLGYGDYQFQDNYFHQGQDFEGCDDFFYQGNYHDDFNYHENYQERLENHYTSTNEYSYEGDSRISPYPQHELEELKSSLLDFVEDLRKTRIELASHDESIKELFEKIIYDNDHKVQQETYEEGAKSEEEVAVTMGEMVENLLTPISFEPLIATEREPILVELNSQEPHMKVPNEVDEETIDDEILCDKEPTLPFMVDLSFKECHKDSLGEDFDPTQAQAPVEIVDETCDVKETMSDDAFFDSLLEHVEHSCARQGSVCLDDICGGSELGSWDAFLESDTESKLCDFHVEGIDEEEKTHQEEYAISIQAASTLKTLYERLETPKAPDPEILVDYTNESDAGYVLIPCSNDVFFEDYITFWWSQEFKGLRHLTAYLEDKVEALMMSAPQLTCIAESSLSNVKLVTLKKRFLGGNPCFS
ncbi:unnamed protein product [Cuscuta epithymum]|uniref:Uncharacterized protein n=2 Tax=Cuscuta epithymum TaxID=186058 RepID=A0AAV0EFN9_9ASTE|nr:unnamed protein product [Cuscuta epithymum]